MCHAFANAMVLALTNCSEVAKSLYGAGNKLLQLAWYFFALGGQFVLFAGFFKYVDHTGVRLVPNEPARAVPAIVRQIIGLVALWCRCQFLLWQLMVVVEMIAPIQERIFFYLLTGCLGLRGARCEDDGKQRYIALHKCMC